MMKTFITVAITTALIGTAAISVPTTAQANGFGAGLATGVIGGAIVGGAIANNQRHYGQGYYDGPVYEDGGYAHCRRVLFHDDYGHETWRRVCN
jgi:hypothetical protein